MNQDAGVFVSHAHEDNEWCRAFVFALRHAGMDVWYDEHNMGYGAIQDEIEREMRMRPIFIVILSLASVNKPWVRREMTAAISLRDRNPERIILPIVTEKVEVPLFWQEYKRVSGPSDAGITAAEAAGRVIHMLAISSVAAPVVSIQPLTTETAEAAYKRGRIMYFGKRHEEALAAFERATDLEPRVAKYWYEKGTMLWHLKRYEEALAALERVLALDPQFDGAWCEVGTVLKLQHRDEEALVALERALALNPLDSIAAQYKAEALARLGRTAEAQEAEHQLDEIGRQLEERAEAVRRSPPYET